jgi:hypothetical protein
MLAFPVTHIIPPASKAIQPCWVLLEPTIAAGDNSLQVSLVRFEYKLVPLCQLIRELVVMNPNLKSRHGHMSGSRTTFAFLDNSCEAEICHPLPWIRSNHLHTFPISEHGQILTIQLRTIMYSFVT